MMKISLPKINKEIFGFGFSVLMTAVVFGLFYVINNIILLRLFQKIIFEVQFLMIFAMGLTILPMQYYTNNGALKTVRGMLIFAFLFTGYIVWKFFWEDLKFSL